MIHGQEKTREMVRSLLPSKNREAARQARALIHRGARRQSRLEMAQLTRDPESFEDLAGLDEDVTAEVRQMVNHRRWGDKDAPFRRWASARAQTLPQSHRLGFIRSLLPSGVIGEHALSHIERDAAFEHPEQTAHREALQRAWRSRRGRSHLDPGEQAELLREVLRVPDGHRAFNQWLKCMKHPTGASERRLLLGEPDVRPFLESIWGERASPSFHGSPRGRFAWQMDRMEGFLRGFKHHWGDLEATLAMLHAPHREREEARRQQDKAHQRHPRASRQDSPYCAQ